MGRLGRTRRSEETTCATDAAPTLVCQLCQRPVSVEMPRQGNGQCYYWYLVGCWSRRWQLHQTRPQLRAPPRLLPKVPRRADAKPGSLEPRPSVQGHCARTTWTRLWGEGMERRDPLPSLPFEMENPGAGRGSDQEAVTLPKLI